MFKSNYLCDSVKVVSLDIQGYSLFLMEYKRYKIGKSSDLSKENFRRAHLKNPVLLALDFYYKEIRRKATIEQRCDVVISDNEGGPVEFEISVPEVVPPSTEVILECEGSLESEVYVLEVVPPLIEVACEPAPPLTKANDIVCLVRCPPALPAFLDNRSFYDVSFLFSNSIDGFVSMMSGAVIPFAKGFDGVDYPLGSFGFSISDHFCVVFLYYRVNDSYGLIIILLNRGGVHKNPGPPMERDCAVDELCPRKVVPVRMDEFITNSNDKRYDRRSFGWSPIIASDESGITCSFDYAALGFHHADQFVVNFGEGKTFAGSNCGLMVRLDDDISHSCSIFDTPVFVHLAMLASCYWRYRVRAIEFVGSFSFDGIVPPTLKYGFSNSSFNSASSVECTRIKVLTLDDRNVDIPFRGTYLLKGDPLKRKLDFNDGDCKDGRRLGPSKYFYFAVDSHVGYEYDFTFNLKVAVTVDFFERRDVAQTLNWHLSPDCWHMGYNAERCVGICYDACPGKNLLAYDDEFYVGSLISHFLWGNCFSYDSSNYKKVVPFHIDYVKKSMINSGAMDKFFEGAKKTFKCRPFEPDALLPYIRGYDRGITQAAFLQHCNDKRLLCAFNDLGTHIFFVERDSTGRVKVDFAADDYVLFSDAFGSELSFQEALFSADFY